MGNYGFKFKVSDRLMLVVVVDAIGEWNEVEVQVVKCCVCKNRRSWCLLFWDV